MTPQIIKLSDDVPFWNNLIYADSGAGKTVLAGSDRRVLFIAPEDSGTLSALRMGSNASKIKVKDWPDLIAAYEYLYDHPEILAEFDVLAIDSVTEMQAMCMRYLLKMSRADKLQRDQDPDQPQLQEYGKLHILFEKMVRAFNDLPVNVLYTALARKVEDADHNEFLVPEIQGKDYGIAMKIVALMTSYGYLRVEIVDVPDPTDENPNRTRQVKQRTIYWEDTGTIRGKDRTNALAPYTTNATLQQIRRAIKGELVRNAEGRIVKRDGVEGVGKADITKESLKKVVIKASPQPVKAVASVPDVKEDKQDDGVELDSVEA